MRHCDYAIVDSRKRTLSTLARHDIALRHVTVTFQITDQEPHALAIEQATRMSEAVLVTAQATIERGRRPLVDVEAAKQLAAELDQRVVGADTTPIVINDHATIAVLEHYLKNAVSEDPTLDPLRLAVSNALL
jgi:ATP-dependent protease Clp ATPase subunit